VSLFAPNPLADLEADKPFAPKSVKAAAAEEKEDCIPTVKPVIKPKAVKRSVFADAVAKPKLGFSEQIKDARKRFKAPAKVMPKPMIQKDC
jgi:hypothetical protein